MAKNKKVNANKNNNDNNMLNIMKQIKETEQKKRESVVNVVIADKVKKVSFDVWWMERSPFIPKHHRKEVIRADFTGRGLGDEELKEAFDAALEKYGLKIKR